MDLRNKPLDRCPVDQFGDPLKPRIAPEPGRQQRIDEAHLIHPTHPPLSAKRITNRKTRLSFCRGLARGERGMPASSAALLVSYRIWPMSLRGAPCEVGNSRLRNKATKHSRSKRCNHVPRVVSPCPLRRRKRDRSSQSNRHQVCISVCSRHCSHAMSKYFLCGPIFSNLLSSARR